MACTVRRPLHAVLNRQRAGVKKIAYFTDGRDMQALVHLKTGKWKKLVLSDCDRFWSLYAMDRDNNWDRMVRAEQRCLIAGKTCRLKPSARRWTACRGLLNKHLEPIVFLEKVVRLRKTEMDFFCLISPAEWRCWWSAFGKRSAEFENYHHDWIWQ